MPEQSQDLSMSEKLKQWEWLVWLPALSVAVILRRDVGLRMLHRVYISGVSAVMFLISLWVQPSDGPMPLRVYAGIVFVVGFFTMFKRAWEFSRHKKQHSYYIGTSPFAQYRITPNFFRRRRRMERFLDPLLCFVIGGLFLPLALALGLWIMFAGAALLCFEGAVYKRTQEAEMDMVDGLVYAEYQGDTVEKFEQAPAAQQREEPAIATGLGDDIARKLEEKRRKQKSP